MSKLKRLIEKWLVWLLMRLPKSWLRRLSGGKPIQIEGKTLDTQIQFMLALAAKRPAINELPVPAARQMYRDMAYTFGGSPRSMAQVEERRVPGPYGDIPVRLYVPHDMPAGPAPLLIFFHGGGFVIGDREAYDQPCRYYADTARCRVLSVDYRLGPEFKFPVPIDECLAVWRHVAANAGDYGADPARLAVGGDSAGGHLSAVVCQQAKLAGDPLPKHQLLIYPVVDIAKEWPSHETYADGFLLTRDAMHWFMGHFLPPEQDRTDIRVSPLRNPDLSGLPPATLVIAGFDPLQDEGRAYGEALAAAGVPVKVLSYDSLVHGLISLGGNVEASEAANADIAASLRAGLAA